MNLILDNESNQLTNRINIYKILLQPWLNCDLFTLEELIRGTPTSEIMMRLAYMIKTNQLLEDISWSKLTEVHWEVLILMYTGEDKNLLIHYRDKYMIIKNIKNDF